MRTLRPLALLAVLVLTAGLSVVDVTSDATRADAWWEAEPSAENFALLRDCESGGDYLIDTGNGYYGAYQFSPWTWWGLGFDGYPHEASAEVQDEAAWLLQSLYGWGQWPGCAWWLGLY